MAEKYYYYIDYGSGDVNINPLDNNLELSWVRGEYNDFIARKELTGSFQLQDSEAIAAEAYYIGSGNIEAPIKIYQNGDISTGTLIYEGWATTEGLFDYDVVGNAITCTFNSFRTNDEYTNLIKYWSESFSFENIYTTSTILGYNKSPKDYTLFENINNTIDSLDAYTFNGTNYVLTGNSLATGNLGRIAGVAVGTAGGGGVLYIDNYTNTLRSKQFISPNWTTLYPDYIVSTGLEGNWTILSNSPTQCILINEDGLHIQLDILGGVWTQTSLNFYDQFVGRFPSICLVNPTAYISPLSAYINDESKNLQAYLGILKQGEPLDTSGISKPKICGLDYTNNIIAMIDEESKLLRAIQYNFTAGTWTLLATIQVDMIENEPTISYSSTNVVNIHDSETGDTERYTFTPGTPGTWALTGATTTIGGVDDGYSSIFVTVANTPTEYIAFIKSGSMVMMDSGTQSLQSYVNRMVTYASSRDGLSTIPALIPDAGSGSDIDVTDLALTNLEQSSDNKIDLIDLNDYEKSYTIKEILQICELFQQYFYLEVSSDSNLDYDIKFTQPDLFSSFGTDIVVDSDEADLLRSRFYNENFKINLEKIKFKNEFNTDFIGNDIRYDRENDVELINNYDLTTDFRYYKQNQLGILSEFNKSGFLMYLYDSGVNNVQIVNAGTVFGGSSYIENSELSKANIHDTYYKDYRYANKGTVTINDIANDASTFNTIRDIIVFPDYQTSLANFPTSIASLDWGGGVKSFIMRLSTRLETDLTTISSRVLDI